MHDSKRKPYEQQAEQHELTPVPGMELKAESLDDFQVGHDGRGSLKLVPGGHIGLFMGRDNLQKVWPEICTWIRSHDQKLRA